MSLTSSDNSGSAMMSKRSLTVNTAITSPNQPRKKRKIKEASVKCDSVVDIAEAESRIRSTVGGKLGAARKALKAAKNALKVAQAKGRAGMQAVKTAKRAIMAAQADVDKLESGVMTMDLKDKATKTAKQIIRDYESNHNMHADAVMSKTIAKLPEMRSLRSTYNGHEGGESNRAKRRRPHTSRDVHALHSGTDSRVQTSIDAWEAEFLDRERKIYVFKQEACTFCGGALEHAEAAVESTCVDCGATTRMLSDSRVGNQNYSAGDCSQLRSCYKRRNHMKEHLSLLQGKEKLTVPDEVLESICKHIRLMGLKRAEDITSQHVLTACKALGLSHLYHHRQLLLCMITGKRPPQLSSAQEQQIMSMFLKCLPAFAECAPPTRKNFLSYSFVTRNLLILCGLPHYANEFVLLKGSDKLSKQDSIWKSMCKKLGWRYIPSI